MTLLFPGVICGMIAALLLGAHLATVALYLRRLRAPDVQQGPLGLPAVTLLRPVCGLDPFDAETLMSSFQQDYPAYEVIFCAPDADDAAVPLVRRLIAANPQVRARLLTGQAAITQNPKLNNLAPGWQAATTDWVCMTDSNLMLPPDYLRQVVSAWRAGTGLVSCPALGSRPGNLGGSLECAFLNSNQARVQFAAVSLGIGFAQGKTLFWNRAMLNKAGGIAALGRYLAEDVNATKLVRARGLRVSAPRLPFAQPVGMRSLRQVWDRQLRWSRVRRDGFPLLFAGEIANGAVLPALLALLALQTAGLSPFWLVPFLAVWYGAEAALIRRAGWPCSLRDLATLPLRDLALPAIWVATFLRRDIEWRGTAMPANKADPAG